MSRCEMYKIQTTKYSPTTHLTNPC